MQGCDEKIICASTSEYGPEGPDWDKPAFALTAEARAGALWLFGPPDDAPHQLDLRSIPQHRLPMFVQW